MKRALVLAWRWLAAREATIWKIVIVLGAIFRALTILLYRGPLDNVWSDPGRHIDNARHFLKPGPMGCSNAYFYQLFLWIIISITKEHKLWTHIITAGLSILYPAVWYGFARHVVQKPVNALRFTALLTYLPTHMVLYQFFMTETAVMPLEGGALWASVSAAKRKSSWRFLLAAFLWTCTILTRSATLPLAGLVLAYSLYRMHIRPFIIRPLLAFAAAAITAGGLWIAAQHSLRIFEYATPFGDSTWTPVGFLSGTKDYKVTFMKPKNWAYVYVYSSPSLYISPFDPFYEWTTSRTGSYAFTTNVETHGKDLADLRARLIKQNKAKLPRLIYENILYLTFGHSWPEAGKGNWIGKLCLQERWIWAPLMLVSVFGGLRRMWRRRELYLVPVITIFSLATLYSAQLVVMEGRYRKPIEPLLFLTVIWLFDVVRPRKVP